MERYEKRRLSAKSKIARKLQITSEEVQTAFPSAGLDFLTSILDISHQVKDWNTILEILDQARQLRYNKKPERVSQVAEWTPWDAKRAKDIIAQAITARSDSTTISSTAVGTSAAQTQCYSSSTAISLSDENVNTSGQRVHVIFCGVSRYRDLVEENSDFISIQIDPAYSSYGDKLLQRFTLEYLCELERTLGRGLVASHQYQFVVHQTVVAMIAAENTGLVSLELHGMKWVSDMVMKHGFASHVADVAAEKVVVFAPWDSDYISDKITEDFYMQMQEATAFHRNLSLYPSRDENYAEGHKLLDIAALDGIARRPGTPPKAKPQRRVTYFHQEYIKSLDDFGEIRVMMCGDDIIEVSRTQWITTTTRDKPRRKLHARAFNLDDDLSWFSSDPEERKGKYSELEAFCVFWRRALIEFFEVTRNFESARVGLRLDIGISPNGDFCINEFPRWFGANWFSEQIRGPGSTEIARKWGERLAQEISRR
ncbi:uncharacterized protein BKA55DRAFT_526693 [Fusarium redolens]|uniref:Uncharacterized protein n=1 Tax=Fusarium redolens TaxID=48865 RepID=A0A9P9G0T3_FUSRE|nr:uncharacterized protein BKA55DRAFT_526693 [Fusarium redolens]KAH7228584.1 hypothetical protein BKA55DRAFT_526693 [Fusarium redolens]